MGLYKRNIFLENIRATFALILPITIIVSIMRRNVISYKVNFDRLNTDSPTY